MYKVQSKIHYSVGIDPDLEESGFAIWDRLKKRIVHAGKYEFSALIDAINSLDPASHDIALDAGWLNPKANYHTVEIPLRLRGESVPQSVRNKYMAGVREEIANRVGQNAGVGLCIQNYLTAHGFSVRPIKPVTAKWDRKMIKLQTGYDKPANEDVRDAIRLAYLYA